jgi:hypothetical protein
MLFGRSPASPTALGFRLGLGLELVMIGLIRLQEALTSCSWLLGVAALGLGEPLTL